MEILLSAKEAYEKVQELKQKQKDNEDEIKYITKEINNAIRNKHCFCDVKLLITCTTKDLLENQGYKECYKKYTEGDFTEIFWDFLGS